MSDPNAHTPQNLPIILFGHGLLGLSNLMTDDRVVKLDPKAEQWTLYQLPSLGCEPRNIAVDDLRGDVWAPCCRTSRVVRVQFRTERQLQALKAASAQAARSATDTNNLDRRRLDTFSEQLS